MALWAPRSRSSRHVARLVLCCALLQFAHPQGAWAAPEDQCKSVTTCFKGDAKTSPCVLSDGTCPPCIVMNTKGCYEYTVGTTTCPFGTDCKPFYNSLTSSNTSLTSGTGSSNNAMASTGSPNNNRASGSKRAGSKNGNDNGNAGSSNASEGSKSSGPSFLAIAGVAIGVVVIAAVFIMLIKRSRARDDDDDDELETPGLTKAVAMQQHRTASTTSQPQYAAFAAPAATQVSQYYAENANPSPRGTMGKAYVAPGPPPQPAKVVRAMPTAYASAPMPPAETNNYPVDVGYGVPVPDARAPPAAAAVAYDIPPQQQQPTEYYPEAPRESRRESFEF